MSGPLGAQLGQRRDNGALRSLRVGRVAIVDRGGQTLVLDGDARQRLGIHGVEDTAGHAHQPGCAGGSSWPSVASAKKMSQSSTRVRTPSASRQSLS